MSVKYKFTSHYTGYPIDEFSEASVTQPDLSYSLQEIVERAQRGLSTSVSSNSFDFDEESDNDFESPTLESDIDPLEMVDYSEQLASSLREKALQSRSEGTEASSDSEGGESEAKTTESSD